MSTHALIPLVGQQFWKWTVLSFDEVRSSEPEGRRQKRRSFWKCQCECGRIESVRASELRAGKTKGCRVCTYLAPGEAAKNVVWRSYKQCARNRNLPWSLTKEDFLKLVTSCCHYCGIEPQLETKKLSRGMSFNGSFIHNGLDRLNSLVGYHETNVVPCCAICNYAKRQMSKDEFLNWVKRVYSHNASTF
jgi:hypothetical protein